MICPICFGRRLFYVYGQLLPCPECEGHGEIHYCDGLQEQPERELHLRLPAPLFSVREHEESLS